MKKGDLMMVGTSSEWDGHMKKGDLVLVLETNVQPRVGRGSRVAQVLHPTGVWYVSKQRLEAV